MHVAKPFLIAKGLVPRLHLAWANFSPGTYNSGNLSCLFFKPLQTELLCAVYQGYQDFVSHKKKV